MTSVVAQTVADQDPLEGTAYRAISLIGRGGMGEVYEAEHIGLGTRVVVKLLLSTGWQRRDLKERMRLEAQTGARIRHENLVLVTDIGETLNGRTFLVMERLTGRTLGDEVAARGPLPAAEAIDIVRQLLLGLSTLHEAGIIHRDIKPDNVFLCRERGGERRVKVLDFGIAKIIDAGCDPRTPSPLSIPTAEGTTVGTPRWFSPEQGRGERSIDGRSDVYSAGLVLWTLLAGQEPFPDRKGPPALLAAHAAEVLPPPSSIARTALPPELEQAIAKALSKRPVDRFPSAAAFREELRRVAESAAEPAPAALRSPSLWSTTEPLDPAISAAARSATSPTNAPNDTIEMALSANRTVEMPSSLLNATRTVELPSSSRSAAPSRIEAASSALAAPPIARTTPLVVDPTLASRDAAPAQPPAAALPPALAMAQVLPVVTAPPPTVTLQQVLPTSPMTPVDRGGRSRVVLVAFLCALAALVAVVVLFLLGAE